MKFIKYIQEYFSNIAKTYNKGKLYDSLEYGNNTLKAENIGLKASYDVLKVQYETKVKELYDFKAPHNDLTQFKTFVDTIKPKKQMYDFGSGKKAVHTIFKESLKDDDVIVSFIEQTLKFRPEAYSSAEKLVFAFQRTLNAKYPTTRYYASDMVIYGKREFWALAKQTIHKLKTQPSKAYDCDDKMVLMFSCLHIMIETLFPNDLWRLRGFVADLWANGGHALLAWVSDKHNDWVALETTFMDHKQYIISNYTIRSQLFYQLRYSFDTKNEYVKL